MDSPFSIGYGTPVKIFGNIGAIGIIVGIGMMMSNRFKKAEQLGGVGSYFDWLLIGIIMTVGISGFLAQLLRIFGIAPMAYPVYFIHLVAVFSLFIYLPFSKLAHMFYRGAAMCFNKYSGREAAAALDAPIASADTVDTSEEAAPDAEPAAEEAEGGSVEVTGEDKQ
jgi:nitrate reductase gamma subunit